MSISTIDVGFQPPNQFCPIREPGVYIPFDIEVSALTLFELFFDRNTSGESQGNSRQCKASEGVAR